MRSSAGAVVLVALMMAACGDSPAQGGPSDAGVDAMPLPDASQVCPDEICQCDVDADCGDHGECILDGDQGTCQCTVGYALIDGYCDWVGLANPSFDEDPLVWEAEGAGGGEVVSEDTVNFWRWPDQSLREMDLIRQTIDMPLYERAQAFVATMTYRRVNSSPQPIFYDLVFPMPAFAVNGRWQSFLPRDLTLSASLLEFHQVRQCLGSRAYGGPVEWRAGTHEASQYNYKMDVDYFNVVPASPGECPAPGTIQNPDFEAVDGWQTRACTALPAGCTAQSFVGIDANAGIVARGGLVEGECSDYLSLEGQISVPEPQGGIALQFTWTGTEDHFLRIGLGSGWRGWITSRHFATDTQPIGTLRGIEGAPATTSRVCLPPWSYGMSMPLKFQIPSGGAVNCNQPRRFAIDNLSIVDDASCPTDGLVDGAFENVASGLLPGWLLPSFTGAAAIELSNTPDAHDGVGAVRMRKDGARTDCSPISATAQLQLPVVPPEKRVKVSAWYKFKPGVDLANAAARLSSEAIVGTPTYPVGTLDTYEQAEACFNPAWHGRTVSLSVTFLSGPIPGFLQPWVCNAAVTTDQEAYFDDVEITIVDAAECP